MLYSIVLVAATAFTGLASAQNYSTSGPLTVDLNQIPIVLRQSWCVGQQKSCPLICAGQASPNTCDPVTMNYTCTCTNGNKPNISDYDATAPQYICSKWRDNCVANHPNDLAGQAGCHSVTCGSKAANSNVISTTSSSAQTTLASSTSASTATNTGAGGTAGSASATSTKAGAAVALDVAKNYGTGMLAAGILAIFGFAL